MATTDAERTQAVMALVMRDKADTEGHAAKYAATTGAQAVDLAVRQVEIQRSFDWMRSYVDADLGGLLVKGKPIAGGTARRVALVKPEGHIVVTIDAGNHTRAARSSMGGHFAEASYQVDGETWGSININPHLMNREPAEILASLTDVYIEVIAHASDVVTTTRQGRYRNQVFEAMAHHSRFLDVAADKSVGCITWASEFLKTSVAEELNPKFGDIVKLLEPEKPKTAAPSPKWVTLKCDCGEGIEVKVPSDVYHAEDIEWAPWCRGYKGHFHKGIRMAVEPVDVGQDVAASGALESTGDDEPEIDTFGDGADDE